VALAREEEAWVRPELEGPGLEAVEGIVHGR
jgi:hypothetical protein